MIVFCLLTLKASNKRYYVKESNNLCLQCCATSSCQHWSSVVITAAWLWCTKSSIDWWTLIFLQASSEPTPILEVTHPESWNTHAVVMLTPAPFTRALHVTGMLYQRTHFSVNQLTHLRTTSALTYHLITVFSSHVILEPWQTQPLCASLWVISKSHISWKMEDDEDGVIIISSRVRTIPAITSILDTSILDSDRYRYSIPSTTTLALRRRGHRRSL